MDAENLMYRRQFIMGNRYVDKLVGWKREQLNEKFFLTIHPDLEHEILEKNGVKLALLGFIIDPYNPEYTNNDVLINILENAKDSKDVLEMLYNYSGRWVIIYHDSNETKIFNDPCGLRQVFYSVKDGDLWCGSQPNIIVDEIKNQRDDDPDLVDFINSAYYENEERFWVGEGTIFKGIKHLMPNHCLNLKNQKSERYWTDHECIQDIETTVKEAATILKGSLIALNKRYDTMLAVTAGWDSRVLLAATKEMTSDIHYFVSTMNMLSQNHMDISIPNQLSKRLNFTLNVIDGLSPLKNEFKTILQKNVTNARLIPKTLTIQHHLEFSGDKVNINGNGSEIVRSYFGHNHPNEIDANFLADLVKYPKLKYVIKSLDEWLSQAVDVSSKTGVTLTDLFYWEQRMGNWGGMYQAEQDIAIEEFSPFNNRKLLMLLYKVDRKYRESPNYIIYEKLMKNMWPDVLQEPINPMDLKTKIKKIVFKVISPSMKANLKALIRS